MCSTPFFLFIFFNSFYGIIFLWSIFRLLLKVSGLLWINVLLFFFLLLLFIFFFVLLKLL